MKSGFISELDFVLKRIQFVVRRPSIRVVVIIVVGWLLLANFGITPAVQATTFTVNNAGDGTDKNTGNGRCETGNNNGICTLRAAIEETNALAAGAPHTINFNIAGIAVGAAATINIGSLLPAITRTGTTIDATTQPNTNTGQLGTGGTVGTGNLALSSVDRPDVQVVDSGGIAIGFDVQANNITIRGLAIYGFGIFANSNDSANIRIGNNFTGTLIERNILGATATNWSDPGAAARSPGDNIRSVGGDSGIVRNNLIGFSAGKGIGVEAGSSNWLIENNEIRGNAIGNSNLDGIDFESAGSTNNTARGNLIAGNEGVGVDSFQSNGSNTTENNTITNNGIGLGGNLENAGVRIFGSNNRIANNIINDNRGAGVMVTSEAVANTITQNSIYGNGSTTNQIGIDLQSTADNLAVGTAPFVTLNDAGDADTGGNNLLNFPVFTGASIISGNLILVGSAPAGSTIELFIAAPDPSGYGEGQTYRVTLTEGSAADADAASGAFRFTFSLPTGVIVGTVLTATATLAASTSEFGPNIAVAAEPPNVQLLKSVTPDGTQAPNTDLTYTIVFTNSGGRAATIFVITDPIPANTDFKLGSVQTDTGTTGLSFTIVYSSNNGASYDYTPISTGGGAPAGYDRSVTQVRWVFTGNLNAVAPNNTGNVVFTVRIR